MAQSDLSVTKTDGQTTLSTGQSITYTIEVANGGPSAVSALGGLAALGVGMLFTGVAVRRSLRERG